MEFTRELIRSVDALKRAQPHFEIAPVLAFDFETTSLADFTVWGVCLGYPPATPDGRGYAAYIGCEDDCEIEWERDLKPMLEMLLQQPKEFVGQNLKFDEIVCREHGLPIPERIFDCMVASWMLTHSDVNRRHNLEAVAKRFLNIDLPKDLMKIRKIKPTNPDFYWEEMYRYGTNDAVVPLQLRAKMIPMLHEARLDRQFKELEMPVVHATAEMQIAGIPLDIPHLNKIEPGIVAAAEQAANMVHSIIGYEFNINSPKQLSKALFDDYGLLPFPGMVRGKKGDWPTGVEVLKNYESEPVAEAVLTYRGRTKLLGTYVRKLRALAEVDPRSRIYTNWNQIGTATGRYSSAKPFNAQNTPREPGAIRMAISPQEPNFSLVACDYSQIELRLMAHMSQDPEMLRAYAEGADLHKRTASFVLGMDEADVLKVHRQLAKPVNFGYLYGMSAKSFMQYAWVQFGVRFTYAEAQRARDAYFSLYRGVKEYHDYMREFIYENGYSLNIIGERRLLPTYRSSDNYLRWRAWSEGTNFTIQGSAAALIKVAMRNIYNELIRPFGAKISDRYGRVVTCWRSASLAHEVRLIMQVHDELVYEVRNEIVEPFAKWLKHMMETALPDGISVPIIADYDIGPNLESAKA